MGSNPFIIPIAVIPALILLVETYAIDRLEKEPLRLLFKLLFIGVIITIPAAIAETLLTYCASAICGFLKIEKDSLIFLIVQYLLIVAPVEEMVKYIGLKKNTWNSKEFNCSFDGVVYAVFVSLGFALCENICYSFRYGFGTILLRAVTAIPCHASCGVFMGIWYALAKKYKDLNEKKSRLCLGVSIALPILFHGAYDTLANMRGRLWLFALFTFVMFVIAFIMIKKASVEDKYIENDVFTDNEVLDEQQLSD